jgi:hypothetical protein
VIDCSGAQQACGSSLKAGQVPLACVPRNARPASPFSTLCLPHTPLQQSKCKHIFIKLFRTGLLSTMASQGLLAVSPMSIPEIQTPRARCLRTQR